MVNWYPLNGTIWHTFEGAGICIYVCMIFSGSSPITWSRILSFDQKRHLGSCLSTVDRVSPKKMLPFHEDTWLNSFTHCVFTRVISWQPTFCLILQVFFKSPLSLYQKLPAISDMTSPGTPNMRRRICCSSNVRQLLHRKKIIFCDLGGKKMKIFLN